MPAEALTRIASRSDVPVLVALINEAFAVERFFKPGDRTSPEEVRALLEKGRFHICAGDDGVPVGCVYTMVHGDRGYRVCCPSILHSRGGAMADHFILMSKPLD